MAPDTITPTKAKSVFFSKSPNHRLTRYSEDVEELAGGRQRPISPGLRYEFDSTGYLVIDDTVRQRDERFFEQYADKLDIRPEEQESAEEWLRKHHQHNFAGPGGFIELDVPKSPSGPVLEQITDALIASDLERLLDIHEAEENGEERDDVLRAARKAIASLEEAPAPGGIVEQVEGMESGT